MKELFEQAVKGCVFEYAVVPTIEINFSPEILKACEANICGNYNKSWSCPPVIGSIDKQKEKIISFSSAFIFSSLFFIEDSFDYEGMMEAKDRHDRLTTELHEKFGKTNPVYGAGGCTICKREHRLSCAFPELCRFPDKLYSSIEAAGINVTELSRKAGIKYNNGENTVTYFSMILFD